MRTDLKDQNVAEFRPRADDLKQTISALALDTSKISWSVHAQDQMVDRDISDADALKVLRNGDIEGEIVAGRSKGEWKCKMVTRIKGNRDVGVVTVVVNGQRLFIKTVEWEDL